MVPSRPAASGADPVLDAVHERLDDATSTAPGALAALDDGAAAGRSVGAGRGAAPRDRPRPDRLVQTSRLARTDNGFP